mmetsp:Transcript_54874/g.116582  ORF Transcript_54874/g.116582 Transcript_54874/m.116582 type:complete len:88 (+) Transcript_54874:2707-2970(+)
MCWSASCMRCVCTGWSFKTSFSVLMESALLPTHSSRFWQMPLHKRTMKSLGGRCGIAVIGSDGANIDLLDKTKLGSNINFFLHGNVL